MSHTLGAPVGPFRDSHDKNIFNSHCLFTLKNLFYVSDFFGICVISKTVFIVYQWKVNVKSGGGTRKVVGIRDTFWK